MRKLHTKYFDGIGTHLDHLDKAVNGWLSDHPEIEVADVRVNVWYYDYRNENVVDIVLAYWTGK